MTIWPSKCFCPPLGTSARVVVSIRCGGFERLGRIHHWGAWDLAGYLTSRSSSLNIGMVLLASAARTLFLGTDPTWSSNKQSTLAMVIFTSQSCARIGRAWPRASEGKSLTFIAAYTYGTPLSGGRCLSGAEPTSKLLAWRPSLVGWRPFL